MPRVYPAIRRWIICGAACLGVTVSAAAGQGEANQVIATIGGPESVGAMLELPSEILVLNHRIVVVEGAAPFLKVFDLDGRPLQSLGRNGSGPGELRHVAATAFNPTSNELLVFDARLGRVSRFDVGDTLTFLSSQLLEPQFQGACFIGDRLFGTTHSNDRLVHELARDGLVVQVIRRFGAISTDHPLHENGVFRGYLGMGPAACDADSHSVTLASTQVGVAHVVSLVDGTQRTIALDGFVPIVMTALPGALQFEAPPSGSFDQVLAVRVGDGVMVFTVGRTDREYQGAGDYATYREIILDRAGRQRVGPMSAWRTIRSTADRTVCYRSSPEPEIAIVRGGVCPQTPARSRAYD